MQARHLEILRQYPTIFRCMSVDVNHRGSSGYRVHLCSRNTRPNRTPTVRQCSPPAKSTMSPFSTPTVCSQHLNGKVTCPESRLYSQVDCFRLSTSALVKLATSASVRNRA